ncbi:MAG: class I SAM-dependent methyltransferase [Candidatus Cloacimonetes bacterium]|nr:class I SAM-dependent methyltransferase [Candidatus Cloacimonadota bacterium]
MSIAIELAERGWLPDFLVRAGIRRLLAARLTEERARAASGAMDAWITELGDGPVALLPEKANEQHYEVPPEFFHAMLGPRLKYSSCIHPQGTESLAEAETLMLELCVQRAGLVDGQRILELGCGWGSLSLFMAQRFPAARITAVSNSAPQRREILQRATALGLSNLDVITADMNNFDTDQRFDRVVSVEMFEHMYNLPLLLRRVRGWLAPGGRLFLHVFCHREYSYPFAVRGQQDWMARHFFSGGMMPAESLYERFGEHMVIENRWVVSGTHYARTSRQWLERLDANREAALKALADAGDPSSASLRLQRWRMFVMACEELFGHDGGREWFVSHQLLRPVEE